MNNRAENSRQIVRRRERKMQRFESAGSAQHFSVCTPFTTISTISRSTLRIFRGEAVAQWQKAVAVWPAPDCGLGDIATDTWNEFRTQSSGGSPRYWYWCSLERVLGDAARGSLWPKRTVCSNLAIDRRVMIWFRDEIVRIWFASKRLCLTGSQPMSRWKAQTEVTYQGCATETPTPFRAIPTC
jgi:hypothetical protein